MRVVQGTSSGRGVTTTRSMEKGARCGSCGRFTVLAHWENGQYWCEECMDPRDRGLITVGWGDEERSADDGRS